MTEAPERAARPIAVVDIDGVLADVRHRLDHLDQRPKDWGGFFRGCRRRTPAARGSTTVRRLAEVYEVVYLSGRPEHCRRDTEAWFRRHGVPEGELHLRPRNDFRPAREFKVGVLRRLSRARPCGPRRRRPAGAGRRPRRRFRRPACHLDGRARRCCTRPRRRTAAPDRRPCPSTAATRHSLGSHAMPHEIDPEFLALPYRQLADAALDRGRALGVEPRRLPLRADPLPAACRSATASCRAPARPRTSASRSAWSTAAPGASPPGSVLDRRGGGPPRRDRGPHGRGGLGDDAAPGRARPRAGARRRDLGLVLRRRPVRRTARREGRAAHRLDRRLLRGRARRARAGDSVQLVLENKFYADLARHDAPPSSGSASTREVEVYGSDASAASSTRCARSPRRPVAAGSTSPATGHDWDAELADAARAARRRSCTAPSVEAGRYDLVIDPSNLWLTIHESIGHATELDRALGYEANYAGTSFATLDQLGSLQYGSADHARHRRPHRRARPGHHRVRRRGGGRPELGHRPGRRPRRLPARPRRWPSCTPSSTTAGPTAAPTPTPPATSRSSGWRTSRCSRPPTARPPTELIGRVERGIYVVGDKSWSIDMQRYNFQFTGQRFYLIEDGAARRPAARRRLPGDHHRLLGLDGGGRRPGDLGARRRVQLRQGPARPGRVGLARLPDRAVPRRQRPQHRPPKPATEPRELDR